MFVCPHGCAIACVLEQALAQCKIFFEGIMLTSKRPGKLPTTVKSEGNDATLSAQLLLGKPMHLLVASS